MSAVCEEIRDESRVARRSAMSGDSEKSVLERMRNACRHRKRCEPPSWALSCHEFRLGWGFHRFHWLWLP